MSFSNTSNLDSTQMSGLERDSKFSLKDSAAQTSRTKAELTIALDTRLKQAGDFRSVVGDLMLDGYELGEHQFKLTCPIHYDVVLTHTGAGILAAGMLSSTIASVCDRCLEPCEQNLSAEIDDYFLFEEPKDTSFLDDEDEELEYSLVNSDNTIDLYKALREAIITETPFVFLCSFSCKGLCPHCGNNRNEKNCDHAKSVSESPFSALRHVKIQKDSD